MSRRRSEVAGGEKSRTAPADIALKKSTAGPSRNNALRLAELRAEIQKGLESGESTPLDVDAIKARGRKRLG